VRLDVWQPMRGCEGMMNGKGGEAQSAGWAVTETREASLETSTGTPQAGREGEYRVA